MNFSEPTCRRILFLCAATVVAAALGVALGVVEPVKAEVARGGTPQQAVYAFWVNIGLALFSAAIIGIIAVHSERRAFGRTFAQVVAGLVVLFLGFALADAASAYRSHGPAMQTASTLLFVLAVTYALAGAVVIATVFVRPRSV